MRSRQETQTAQGEVIAVQEQFFRLVTDSGQGLLLTLSGGLTTSAEDLCRYRDNRTRVEVEYEGQPGLQTAVASSIQPITDT